MNNKELEAKLPPNPFLPNLTINATSRLSFTEFTEKDDSNYCGPRPFLLDNSPHMKVYLDSPAVHIINALSDCAKSLLLYIIFNLKPGKDYVIISTSEYEKASGTKSRTTVAKAKTELARLCFISPTSIRSVFFINPAYFFRGSRTYKYRDNTVITFKHEEG